MGFYLTFTQPMQAVFKQLQIIVPTKEGKEDRSSTQIENRNWLKFTGSDRNDLKSGNFW